MLVFTACDSCISDKPAVASSSALGKGHGAASPPCHPWKQEAQHPWLRLGSHPAFLFQDLVLGIGLSFLIHLFPLDWVIPASKEVLSIALGFINKEVTLPYPHSSFPSVLFFCSRQRKGNGAVPRPSSCSLSGLLQSVFPSCHSPESALPEATKDLCVVELQCTPGCLLHRQHLLQLTTS